MQDRLLAQIQCGFTYNILQLTASCPISFKQCACLETLNLYIYTFIIHEKQM